MVNTENSLLPILASLLIPYLCAATTELLKNGNFESDLGSSWECLCDLHLTQEKHSGKTALLAVQRKVEYSGPGQYLPLSEVKPGRQYLFRAHIKLRSYVTITKPPRVKVTIMHTFKDNSKREYQFIGQKYDPPMVKWFYIEFRFFVKDYHKALKSLFLYLEGPIGGISIILDSASLTAVSPTTTVTPTTTMVSTTTQGLTTSPPTAIEKKIESTRKGNLTVTFFSDVPINDVKVKFEQLRHEFGFGSGVDATLLQTNAAYKQWYLDNFEWAELKNAMDWRHVELIRGQPNWNSADRAVNILENNGKKLRGHSILWALAERVPDWVQSINSRVELYVMCMKRTTEAVSRYAGRLEHWDVYNEMMAGNFFENKYGSTSIRYDMFKKSKEVDPNVKLFLNDYNVISGGSNLQKYIDMVNEFRTAGVPLDGIGVQGHFSGRPQASTVKNRLDQLAKLNLPIWVTELDYAHPDDQERADVLEELLTVFFSHPSVDGILFSEFNSETHWRGLDAALLDGFSIETSQSRKIQRYWLNAAGRMWQRLFHQQWRTNLTNKVGNVKQGERKSTSVKAFYGDYKVSVSVGGKVVTTRDVTIRKEQGSQHLNIQLNSNGVIG